MKSIADKYNSGDVRKRKLPVELFLESMLLSVSVKHGHGFYAKQAAAACRLSQNTNSPVDTLSKAAVGKQMLRRDWRLFRDIFKSILRSCQHLLSEQDKWYLKRFKDARIVDSSVVSLNKVLLNKFRATTKDEAALKIHSLFSLKRFVPLKTEITEQCSADVKFDFLSGKKNILYTFDLGYWDYGLFDKIMEQGSFFISRLKDKSNVRIESILCKGYSPFEGRKMPLKEFIDCSLLSGESFDAIVKLGDMSKHLRLVGLKHKEEWYFYVTNITDEEFSPEIIYEIYRLRWQIELFFKWLKHILKLEHITGERVNSIMSEIYAVMIVFLLTRLMIELASELCDVNLKKFSMEKCLNLMILNIHEIIPGLMRGVPPPKWLLLQMASPLGLKERRRKSSKLKDSCLFLLLSCLFH